MAKKPTSLLKPDDYKWTWADFDDWYIGKQKDKWPTQHETDMSLTFEQKQIVKRNQEILENVDAWYQKNDAFMELILKKGNTRERKTFQFNLHGAIFENKLNFDYLPFPCAVNFIGAKFKGAVSFNEAHFFADLVFDRVVFNGDIHLLETEIEGDFWLYNLTYCNMIAQGVTIKGNLRMNSHFESAQFDGIGVEKVTSFLGSSFSSVPDFRFNDFKKAPNLNGILVPSPKMSGDLIGEKTNEMEERNWFGKLKRHFEKARDKSDVAKYRKLKAMALASNDHEKDGEFFAYEMMAKRGYETTGFGPLLLNSLYWFLSFYGQSVVRPFLAMLTSWFCFWLYYIYTIGFKAEPWDRLYFATIHSIQNVIPLIGTLFRTTSTPEGHTSWYDEAYHQLVDKGLSSDWWAALSAFQQIIGAVLFFLLFLGLRNKFRLK